MIGKGVFGSIYTVNLSLRFLLYSHNTQCKLEVKFSILHFKKMPVKDRFFTPRHPVIKVSKIY